MRELEGLSYDSIGNRMGLTRGAVESLLFRARRRLRDGFDEIDTGARCASVRLAMDGVADGSARARDRRRLSNHLNHCKPCRRHAVAMGLDSLVIGAEQSRTRRAIHRAAAFLPLPAFLRRRLEDASTGLGTAASVGVEQGATWAGKATAVVVAAVIAAGGAGVAHKASGGALPGGNLPVVGGSGDAGAGGAGGSATGGGAGGAAGGGSGHGAAGGASGGLGGTAGGSGPAGPNGPAGGAQGGVPGAAGSPLGAVGGTGGPVSGQTGRLTQTLPGTDGAERTVESIGGLVGISPGKTTRDITSGNVGAVTKDVGKTVKNAPHTVKNLPKTVKDAPKTVKEVTKVVPKPKVSVPKQVKLPAGGSVNTGETGKTGPSVTVPQTRLTPSVPPLQLPPLPSNQITSGLGL
jgi:hypothetical protein